MTDEKTTSPELGRHGTIPEPPPPFAPVQAHDAYWRAHVYCADKEPQLTWRASIVGGFLGILACASALYTTLTIGWGFCVNISVCILSFIAFNFLRNLSSGRIRPMGVLENGATSSIANITGITPSHTVVGVVGGLLLLGTSQGGVKDGFMPWYLLAPITFFSSLLGTLIGIPLKRSVINAERLRFPSSIALAETLRTLYAHGAEAVDKARCLIGGIAVGAFLGLWKGLPEIAAILKKTYSMTWLDEFLVNKALPEMVAFPGFLNPMNWWQIQKGVPAFYGVEVSLMLFGAGMIVGLRVSLSMLGTALLVNCLLLPNLVLQDQANVGTPGWIPNLEARVDPATGITTYLVYKWSLWCGTAVMVCAGLTSLAMQWRSIARAFTSLLNKKNTQIDNAHDPLADLEVPMKWFFIGIIPASLGLILTMWLAFDISPFLGLIAVLLSFVTGLICTRSCGEADVNPIGAMGKLSQLLYSVLPGARGNASVNLITAGVTATAGGSTGDLVADMKVGYQLGMNPRQQFWSQIIGVVLGTIIIVPMWYLMIPDKAALESYNPPTASMWAAVAKFLTDDATQLAHSTKVAMVTGALIGIFFPIIENLFPRWRRYMPSSMGVGIAMILPSAISNSLAFSAGAVVAWLWFKYSPKKGEKYCIPLASGFVAGESVIAAFIAIGATLLKLWPEFLNSMKEIL
ncbi:MAG: OPT/YSL family transporter [Puniceicoccales bacterium]|jgi:OPT family oligopeptide transporter|nr:OPT/YSL family transporter [Puniceicoccales bacterium]